MIKAEFVEVERMAIMRSLVFLALLLLPALTFAKGQKPDVRNDRTQKDVTVVISTGEQTFVNTPDLCKQNDTCNLKEVLFRKENYMIPASPGIPDDLTIYSTKMFAGYKTRSVEDLRDYIFVQFIRGCMWYSYLTPEKKVNTEFGVVRRFLGAPQLPHVFPDWVVDTNDDDPAYSTDGEQSDRHYFLQWEEKVPTWIPSSDANLFGEMKPVIPFGFITDAPGPAIYSPALEIATNMSLEFKTCLFKTSMVPKSTNGKDLDVEKAIVCFRWESKYVFDHQKQAFESPKELDPECDRPFTQREEKVRQHGLDRKAEKPLVEEK